MYLMYFFIDNSLRQEVSKPWLILKSSNGSGAVTVIYVDILILINFAVNLLLLRATAFFAAREFSPLKAGLSAFVGSLSSLIILLPPYGMLTMLGYKLVFCGLMVFLAFGYSNWVKYLKDVFYLFLTSFIFSGIMFFIYISLRPYKMTVYNGVFYMNVSALFLIATASICYFLTSLAERLIRGTAPLKSSCLITVYHNNGVKTMRALVDTGNSLIEPFSHLPVIVCCDNGFQSEVLPQKAVSNSFRMIPFDSVGGNGALPAFMPDMVNICFGKKEVGIRKGCYIAVSSQKIGNGDFDAIVNPVLLDSFLK